MGDDGLPSVDVDVVLVLLVGGDVVVEGVS